MIRLHHKVRKMIAPNEPAITARPTITSVFTFSLHLLSIAGKLVLGILFWGTFVLTLLFQSDPGP